MDLGTNELKDMMIVVSEKITENEPYLTEIDTLIGDADHGIGMKRGFSALRNMLSTETFETPAELMHASGIELLKTMGGASGVLFGTLFIAGVDLFGNTPRIDLGAFSAYIDKGTNAVMARGKTALGDKTMVDALAPAAGALKTAVEQGLDMCGGLSAASKAAWAGVEATKDMKPIKGRAKNFKDNSLRVPDPGAVSAALILEAMYEYVNDSHHV